MIVIQEDASPLAILHKVKISPSFKEVCVYTTYVCIFQTIMRTLIEHFPTLHLESRTNFNHIQNNTREWRRSS